MSGIFETRRKTMRYNKLINNITQFLGCAPWHRVSSKYDSPLLPRFLIYGEHSGCVLCSLRQTSTNLVFSIFLQPLYLGKKPSSSYGLLLCRILTFWIAKGIICANNPCQRTSLEGIIFIPLSLVGRIQNIVQIYNSVLWD